MVDLFGFDDAAEVHGTEAMSYVHPDDREAIRQRMHHVLDDGEESDWIGWRLLRNDGAIRHVESRGTPVEYEGRPAVQVVIRDMTDERRRERQLRALADAVRDLAATDTPATAAETAVEAVETLFADPAVVVFERVDGTFFELATGGAAVTLAAEGGGLPESAIEAEVHAAGEPRTVEGYADHGDGLTDRVGAVSLYPLADHGLLWVGADGFDAADRDLLAVLGQSLVCAFDRLAA